MLIARLTRAVLAPRATATARTRWIAPPRALRLSTASQCEDQFERGLALLDEGSVTAAVGEFQEAAAAGSADGNFYLALAYDNLLGSNARGEPPVEPSAEAAFRCYRRAAEAGHAEAMLNLSFCYRNGEGVGQDIRTAFEWTERSAAAGSERASFNAGRTCRDLQWLAARDESERASVALDPLHPPWGKPRDERPEHAMIPKQPERAVEYYRQAVEAGHPKAKVNLGIALYTGTGCAKDVAAAAELWKDAAEEGITQADFCLKNMESSPGKLENYFDERYE